MTPPGSPGNPGHPGSSTPVLSISRDQYAAARHRLADQPYDLQHLDRLVFQPQGVMIQAMCSRYPEILCEGPAGTGKSRLLLSKLHRCCMKYRAIRCLIVRKTKESIPESLLTEFEDVVLPPDSPIKRGPNRRNRQFYLYPNESRIVIGGLDNVDRIMSSQYDLIYLAEATEVHRRDDYMNLLTRLRHHAMPYQQMMVDCNPVGPEFWLNKRPDELVPVNFEKPDGPKRRAMRRFCTRHTDNPAYWDDQAGDWTPRGRDYMGVLHAMSGIQRKRKLLGLWVAGEGAVYEDVWAPAVHIVEQPPDPRTVAYHFASVDWGFRNPGVIQVWAVTNDNQMYCVHEIYRRGKLLSDYWIPRAKALRDQYAVRVFVCDPSDADKLAEFEAAGMIVKKANNNIILGIDKVVERLRVKSDGQPDLFFVAGRQQDREQELAEDDLPTSTTGEFSVYMYPEGKDGKPVKEVPVKANDHGMDAMRYGVMHAFAHAPGQRVTIDRAKRRGWRNR